MKQSRINAAIKRRGKIEWLTKELEREDLEPVMRKKHKDYIGAYRRADKAFVKELIEAGLDESILDTKEASHKVVDSKPIIKEEIAVEPQPQAVVTGTMRELHIRRMREYQAKSKEEKLEIKRRGLREAEVYNKYN